MTNCAVGFLDAVRLKFALKARRGTGTAADHRRLLVAPQRFSRSVNRTDKAPTADYVRAYKHRHAKLTDLVPRSDEVEWNHLTIY
jgi:hypothetical protein